MPMTLAELLALLPDNTTGEIDPADMRTVTTELFNKAAAGTTVALLASTQHNPGTASTVATTSATYADVDAANLTITFTAPASGAVIVSLTAYAVAFHVGEYSWGLRSAGSDVTGSKAAVLFHGSVSGGQSNVRVNHRAKITGLTASTSYTYTWSHARTGGTTTTEMIWGGALGPALMEVWSA